MPGSTISSSQRKHYNYIYQKYRKKYHLKSAIVLLGDLTNLDTKVFRPSRKMQLLLYHNKTALEKALAIVDEDSDEEIIRVHNKRSRIHRLFDSEEDDDDDTTIMIKSPMPTDNEKLLEVELQMKCLFESPKGKEQRDSSIASNQDEVVDANKKSQVRSLFDSDDDDSNSDASTKNETSKTVPNSKEGGQDPSITSITKGKNNKQANEKVISSDESSSVISKKSQVSHTFDSESSSNSDDNPTKIKTSVSKSKDHAINVKNRLEEKIPHTSKGETSNPTNESGKIIHIFGASFLQQYKCDQCYQTFDDCFKLKRHTMVAHKTKTSDVIPKLDHACHICSKRFSDRNMLWNHMRIHSLRDKYSCKLCKFEANSVRELIDHKPVCKGKKQKGNKTEEKTNSTEKDSTEDVIMLETNNTEKLDNFERISNNEKKTSNINNKPDDSEKISIDNTELNKTKKNSNKGKKSTVNSDKTNKDIGQETTNETNNIEETTVNEKNKNSTEGVIDSINEMFNDIEKINDISNTDTTEHTEKNNNPNIVKEKDIALKYRCNICKKKFADINEMRTHKKLHSSQHPTSEKKTGGLRTTLLVDMVVTTDNSSRANVTTSVTIAIANNTTDIMTVASSNLSKVILSTSSPDKAKSSLTKSDNSKPLEMKLKFKCCGKIFSERIQLFLHMKEESEKSSDGTINCDPLYFCDICSNTFHERLIWYRHSKIKHKNFYEQKCSKSAVVMRKPKYACTTCYRKFDSFLKLNEHKLICGNSELNRKRVEISISDLKNQFEKFYQSKTVDEIDKNQNEEINKNQNDNQTDGDNFDVTDPNSDAENTTETNAKETESCNPDTNIEINLKVENQETEDNNQDVIQYRCDICYDEFTQHSEFLEHEAFHREIATPPLPRPLDMPDLLDANNSNQEISQQDQNRERVVIPITLLNQPQPTTSNETCNINPTGQGDPEFSMPNTCFNKEIETTASEQNNPDDNVAQDSNDKDKSIEELFSEFENLINPSQDQNTPHTNLNESEDCLVIDEQPIEKDNSSNLENPNNEIPQPPRRIYVKDIRDLMNPDILPQVSGNSKKTQAVDESQQNKQKLLFRCEECNQGFGKMRGLRKHQRFAKFRYHCLICNFATCSSKKRKVHYNTEHKGAFIAYCCGRDYFSPVDLLAHQQSHNKCPVCKGSFRNLKRHNCQATISVAEVIQSMQTGRSETISNNQSSSSFSNIPPLFEQGVSNPAVSTNTQESTNSNIHNYHTIWQRRM